MTIDILIPFYGDPRLLAHAVRSVQQQDDDHWQLTVVDDHYPDGDVARWLAALSDPRIRYVRNETTLGTEANSRRCVQLIEHDRTVIMGGDDLLLPHYVRTVRRIHADHPDLAMIQPGVQIVDEHGQRYRTLTDSVKRMLSTRLRLDHTPDPQTLAASLLQGNWLYFPAIAWRSDALHQQPFRNGWNAVHDLALVIDLLTRGERLHLEPTECFCYRRHRASDSAVRALNGQRFVEQDTYFHTIAAELEALGWPRAARAARHHLTSRLHALTTLPQALRHGHHQAARRLLTHAFAAARVPQN